MMHYNNIVVSICDANRKSLREYEAQRIENGRKTNVHMPFNTEYQILVKNNQSRNIRLDIDIDGSNVTNDGIVIRPWYTVYLERFLNSQNKFKFVPVSNEGVADPSSKENGIITVVSHFELEPPKPVVYEPLHYTSPKLFRHNLRCSNSVLRGSSSDVSYKSCEPKLMEGNVVNYSQDVIGTSNLYGSTTGTSLNWMSEEHSVCDSNQAGATVEGSKSNQQFNQVHWNGDDLSLPAYVFKFKLLGMDNKESKEWQEYMRLKEKFNAA